jgi:hypothetical protein
MSTDAGSAAAPEDTATQEVAGDRPGLESADPGSADSATSTPETADRGTGGSTSSGDDEPEPERDETEPVDRAETDDSGYDPAGEGFVASMLRDATVTGLPGETGAPPPEPHAPEAQQEGDEPVGDG